MGYGTRCNNQIQTFTPDDTENEFYVLEDISLHYLLELIRLKWPEVLNQNVRITSEHIQTDCLPRYSQDSSDYTNYLKISKI